MSAERLSPDQVKIVLRRASELANARTRERAQVKTEQETAVSPTEVEEIAADVGIPAEAVRRALAENRSGLLPVKVDGPTVLDRALGSHEFVVQRVITGNPAALRAHLARFMETQVMTVDRDLGEQVFWRRSPGLLHGARRFFGKVMGEAIGFLEGMEIETRIVPDGEKAIVSFHVRGLRLRKKRTGTIIAGSLLGGLLVFLGLQNGGAVTGIELFSIIAGGGAAVGSYYTTTKKYRSEMAQARLVVDRFLDALERGRIGP